MVLLLVDDEPSLLQLLGQHLVRQGHTVQSASSVAEARAVSAQASFDFALIDWSLPDGTGLDVGVDLLERDKAVRVVFASGYPLDPSIVPSSLRSRVRVLQKPFLPRALAELLKGWV